MSCFWRLYSQKMIFYFLAGVTYSILLLLLLIPFLHGPNLQCARFAKLYLLDFMKIFQCCGSELVSRSRVLMTKNWEKFKAEKVNIF
jgi:hypothetical protein